MNIIIQDRHEGQTTKEMHRALQRGDVVAGDLLDHKGKFISTYRATPTNETKMDYYMDPVTFEESQDLRKFIKIKYERFKSLKETSTSYHWILAENEKDDEKIVDLSKKSSIVSEAQDDNVETEATPHSATREQNLNTLKGHFIMANPITSHSYRIDPNFMQEDPMTDQEILDYLTDDMGFSNEDFKHVVQHKDLFKAACSSSGIDLSTTEFERFYGIIENAVNGKSKSNSQEDDFDRAMSIL